MEWKEKMLAECLEKELKKQLFEIVTESYLDSVGITEPQDRESARKIIIEMESERQARVIQMQAERQFRAKIVRQQMNVIVRGVPLFGEEELS